MCSLFTVINRNRFYVGVFFLIAAGYIGIVEYSKHDCLSRGDKWFARLNERDTDLLFSVIGG